ncbi:MAG: LysE family translocator [SAR324 cluster bacterium]|nr:LysE family translocator [SAR324 cluster bacterium]
MDPYTWLIYSVAALGLSLSPGPNGLLALTHGALYGWRRTISTIAGGALGFTILIALSLFGIGTLLQSTLIGLTVLKLVGGAYLIWLGIQVWRAPPIGDTLAPVLHSSRTIVLFRQGALSAVTNPKGILFFAAFSQTHITASLYDASRPKLLQPWSMPLRHCQFNFVYK